MFKLLHTTALLTLCVSLAAAGNIAGYHYEKPPTVALSLIEGPATLENGHSFAPLPTVQPLPPVPAMPPLPTPRPKEQYIQTQTIYQTHPVTTFTSSNIGKIAQQYSPPILSQHSATASMKSEPTGTDLSAPSSGLGSNVPNPAALGAQPLRVPFGKQAIINFPSGAGVGANYQAKGRELKQYAVIEIIDNDIEQNTQPFLNSPFFENYRAHSGTPAPFGGVQLGSTSGSALLGQQLSAFSPPNSDAVALGSGGLGFIRLANGNVYLGSGSLGYVSGQQHNQEIHEARTRSGAPQPDALHFGHGPAGNSNRFNKFSYRFK